MAGGSGSVKLILAFDHAIEGQKFKAGTQIGVQADGKITSGVAGVTPGHIEARIRRRIVVTEEQYKARLAAAVAASAQAKVATPVGDAAVSGELEAGVEIAKSGKGKSKG